MINRNSGTEELKCGVTFWSLAKSVFGLLTLRECRIAAGLEIYFWNSCQSVNSLGHDQAWHLVGVNKPEEAGSGIDPV
jgi:hypothetical protein